jgi:hypothetical protein
MNGAEPGADYQCVEVKKGVPTGLCYPPNKKRQCKAKGTENTKCVPPIVPDFADVEMAELGFAEPASPCYVEVTTSVPTPEEAEEGAVPEVAIYERGADGAFVSPGNETRLAWDTCTWELEKNQETLVTLAVPRCQDYVTAANVYLGLDLIHPCEEARMRGLCTLDPADPLHDPVVLYICASTCHDDYGLTIGLTTYAAQDVAGLGYGDCRKDSSPTIAALRNWAKFGVWTNATGLFVGVGGEGLPEFVPTSAPTVAPTSAPTVSPTPAPTPSPTNVCATWCRWHPSPWSEKCNFASCWQCNRCLTDACASTCADYRNGASESDSAVCAGPAETGAPRATRLTRMAAVTRT